MLKHGHKILSALALVLAYFIAKDIFKIPVIDIFLRYPLFSLGLLVVYFFFSTLVDKIEKGGYSHRSILHSKFVVILCIIGIPLTILKGLESSPYFFFITSAIISHLNHLIIDSWSKSLPTFF